MTTHHAFTGTLRTVTGDGVSGVSASLGTNLGAVALVDLDGTPVHLPELAPVAVAEDGTFSIQLIATDSTGINAIDGTLRYTLFVSYRDAQGKARDWNSSPFELTADTDLSEVAGTGISVDVDASAALVGSLVTQAVAPVVAGLASVESATSELADDVQSVIPRASAWPLWLYGASYSTLLQVFFTAGRHWSQILAALAGAGTITSYGVNGRRALDVVLALLQGQPMSGITGIVAGAKWPGTSARSGVVVHDALGNDGMAQAAMNAGTITVVAITGTNYINYLKQHWRAALALMSSEARVENHSHTATSGTWTHSSAAAWPSGGDSCFTTEVGASADYPITPPQRGPLAGKVWVFLAGDLAAAAVLPNVTIAIDGGTASAPIPSYKHTYTGSNGTQVKGFVNAIPVTLPVDGAAHTIRVAQAGSAGQFMVVDVVAAASEDPNPILCMGIEHQLAVHASGLDAADLLAYNANMALVTAAYKEVVAEFPNAIYVPSTVTLNGLWSGDGLHLNDRGNEQRAADAWAAISRIKARLDSRALAQLPDADFGVV